MDQLRLKSGFPVIDFVNLTEDERANCMNLIENGRIATVVLGDSVVSVQMVAKHIIAPYEIVEKEE